jgi:hypothetical protein
MKASRKKGSFVIEFLGAMLRKNDDQADSEGFWTLLYHRIAGPIGESHEFPTGTP